jgi:hypothetical protein
VVGGVLVIPTFEESGTKQAAVANEGEQEIADGDSIEEVAFNGKVDEAEIADVDGGDASRRKSTRHLIERAVQRLIRAGGRKTEGDAPHLLEAISVVVYDPSNGELDANLPAAGSGLRWGEFIDSLVAAYKGRFED